MGEGDARQSGARARWAKEPGCVLRHLGSSRRISSRDVLEEDHSDCSDGMELDRVVTRRVNESRLWQL